MVTSTACADDGSGGPTATDTSDAHGSGGPAATNTSDADGSASGMPAGTSDDDGSESGTPPGTPALEPGSCGWAGDIYACGYADVSGAACPATAVAGMPCDDTDLPAPCCAGGDTRLWCTCAGGNSCDYVWLAETCAQGQGAGTCGWSGDAYTCGGQGEDPAGAPIECPPEDPSAGCMQFATCCDADGNARTCICENVCNWEITDCVLDD